MKRLGIRKVLAKVGETKLGKVIDTVVSVPVIKVEGALNTVAQKSGLNKVKIDVTGKKAKKRKTAKMDAKIEQIKRNTVEQEARDIAAAKEFDREKQALEITLNVGTRTEGVVLKSNTQRDGMCVKLKVSDIKEKASLKEGERV